eukprot:1290824-Lingulodinium_polyedra.AAC.1
MAARGGSAGCCSDTVFAALVLVTAFQVARRRHFRGLWPCGGRVWAFGRRRGVDGLGEPGPG